MFASAATFKKLEKTFQLVFFGASFSHILLPTVLSKWKGSLIKKFFYAEPTKRYLLIKLVNGLCINKNLINITSSTVSQIQCKNTNSHRYWISIQLASSWKWPRGMFASAATFKKLEKAFQLVFFGVSFSHILLSTVLSKWKGSLIKKNFYAEPTKRYLLIKLVNGLCINKNLINITSSTVSQIQCKNTNSHRYWISIQLASSWKWPRGMFASAATFKKLEKAFQLVFFGASFSHILLPTVLSKWKGSLIQKKFYAEPTKRYLLIKLVNGLCISKNLINITSSTVTLHGSFY